MDKNTEKIIVVNNSAALNINSLPHCSCEILVVHGSSHVIALYTVLYNSNIKLLLI